MNTATVLFSKAVITYQQWYLEELSSASLFILQMTHKQEEASIQSTQTESSHLNVFNV